LSWENGGTKSMKAGLTIWEGRISPVFDVSRQALILTIDNGVVSSRNSESIEAHAPTAKIERLLALGIETLVCGAISTPLHYALTAKGVKVIAFVAGEIDDVVAGLLAGKLPSEALSMPGCCRERKRFRGGRGREGGGGDGCGCKRRQ
jgi:predicted Fe-Mo cluster-binding NifX family protein